MSRIAFLWTVRIAFLGCAASGVGCSMAHEGGNPPPVSGSGAGTTASGSGNGSGAGTGSSSGSGSGAISGSGSGAMAISGGLGAHSGGSGASASGAGTGTGSPSGDAGAGSDLACIVLTTSAACDTCCTNNHPVGEQAYQDAIGNCICGPPNGTNGVCQTQCAQTDCSSDQDASSITGDPCDLCQTQAVDGDGGACAKPGSDAF